TVKHFYSSLKYMEGYMSAHQFLSNTEVLMFITGWQGGTIHQLSKHLGVSNEEIIDADYDKMQILMRLAQQKNVVVQALKKKSIDQSWAASPDRAGGQFTEEEVNNAGKWI